MLMTGCSGIDHKWTGIGGNGQHLRFTGQRDQAWGMAARSSCGCGVVSVIVLLMVALFGGPPAVRQLTRGTPEYMPSPTGDDDEDDDDGVGVSGVNGLGGSAGGGGAEALLDEDDADGTVLVEPEWEGETTKKNEAPPNYDCFQNDDCKGSTFSSLNIAFVLFRFVLCVSTLMFMSVLIRVMRFWCAEWALLPALNGLCVVGILLCLFGTPVRKRSFSAIVCIK
jgi:hypothetical protein